MSDGGVHGQNEGLAQHEADTDPCQILLVTERFNDCGLNGCDLDEDASKCVRQSK